MSGSATIRIVNAPAGHPGFVGGAHARRWIAQGLARWQDEKHTQLIAEPALVERMLRGRWLTARPSPVPVLATSTRVVADDGGGVRAQAMAAIARRGGVVLVTKKAGLAGGTP